MYLLDTSVFIAAHRQHYGFDFHPGFWDWLIHANTKGRVLSIKEVYDEICRQEDRLAMWTREHERVLFPNLSADADPQLDNLAEYLYKTYIRSDVRKFCMEADYSLIACAMSKNLALVTHEVSQLSRGRIKIPDVCETFNVECISPFEMLRREKVRFVWEPEP